MFTDWPATSWNPECFLAMLELNLTSLLSVSTKKEREKALAEFKDRNSDVQVLVTSMRVSAIAVDLQKCCSDMVFMGSFH